MFTKPLVAAEFGSGLLSHMKIVCYLLNLGMKITEFFPL